MKNRCLLVVACMGCFCFGSNRVAAEKPAPRVEVVFALDTTGSMGGLIAGAKEKIWFIANQIVAGDPTPDVRMGLVAYRDKGDEYVTRVYDLTDNIDQVYADLMGFQARGGGDFPENVNQALFDALHAIAWSTDRDALRIVYLVGDAPPHPYDDVPSHEELAAEAVRRDIIINTIQCGRHPQTAAIWQTIANLAEGRYLQIDQGGGVRHIATPYDDDMAALNAKLMGTAVVYGTHDVRIRQSALNRDAAGYDVPAAAERAVFAGRSGTAASHDLLDAVRRDRLSLDDLEEAKLPEPMQTMSQEERAAYLAEMQHARDIILKEIQAVAARRDAFIKQHLAENDEARHGFDYQVVEALRSQASKAGIRYD